MEQVGFYGLDNLKTLKSLKFQLLMEMPRIHPVIRIKSSTRGWKSTIMRPRLKLSQRPISPNKASKLYTMKKQGESIDQACTKNGNV